jgi:hypothetical protein
MGGFINMTAAAHFLVSWRDLGLHHDLYRAILFSLRNSFLYRFVFFSEESRKGKNIF